MLEWTLYRLFFHDTIVALKHNSAPPLHEPQAFYGYFWGERRTPPVVWNASRGPIRIPAFDDISPCNVDFTAKCRFIRHVIFFVGGGTGLENSFDFFFGHGFLEKLARICRELVDGPVIDLLQKQKIVRALQIQVQPGNVRSLIPDTRSEGSFGRLKFHFDWCIVAQDLRGLATTSTADDG